MNFSKINYPLFSTIVLVIVASLITPEYFFEFNVYFNRYFKNYVIINIVILYVFIFMFICYHIVAIACNSETDKQDKQDKQDNEFNDLITTKEQVINLSDRMKNYEINCQKTLTINGDESFIIRLDGRNFSRLTSQFEKPFDDNFSKIMLNVAVDVFKHFNPTFIHVQSDEISLIFKNRATKEEYDIEPHKFNHIFGGRVIKILTIIASYASSRFYHNLYNFLKDTEDDKYNQLKKMFNNGNINISFDSRLSMLISNNNNDGIIHLNDHEIINYVYWRSVIAGYTNAVSMFASKIFSSTELESVSTEDRIKKMMVNNKVSYDFNNQKNHIKYGWFIKNSWYIVSNNLLNKTSLKKNPTAYSFKIKYSNELKENFMGESWDESKIKDSINLEIMGF